MATFSADEGGGAVGMSVKAAYCGYFALMRRPNSASSMLAYCGYFAFTLLPSSATSGIILVPLLTGRRSALVALSGLASGRCDNKRMATCLKRHNLERRRRGIVRGS